MSGFAAVVLIGAVVVVLLALACAILVEIRDEIRKLKITVNEAPNAHDFERVIERAVRRAN
ncbi:MAG: hypothetical protein IPK52_22040 [Chloroflexi bacterium]|nr:hypothetical protein [Chloroflexota bacterium]